MSSEKTACQRIEAQTHGFSEEAEKGEEGSSTDGEARSMQKSLLHKCRICSILFHTVKVIFSWKLIIIVALSILYVRASVEYCRSTTCRTYILFFITAI